VIIPDEMQARDDYKACTYFHGHTCMGLTLGYMAAKLGMQYLKEQRALDEELVCITETDACCCDAIQILTGCTFGKGNLIYKDIGKMAFTFGSRTSGIGVRIAMRPGVMDAPENERLLAEKIRSQTASEDEIGEYEALHQSRSTSLFGKGPDAFFATREITLNLPDKARMAPSRLCDCCNEPVMSTKLQEINGKLLCRSCNKADKSEIRGD